MTAAFSLTPTKIDIFVVIFNSISQTKTGCMEQLIDDCPDMKRERERVGAVSTEHP